MDDDIIHRVTTKNSEIGASNPDIQDLQWMEALRFSNKRASIINDDPSNFMFTIWFAISCYFPVITACLAPVANTLSVACVVEKWRDVKIIKEDGTIGHHYKKLDPPVYFVLNCLSLAIGCASNVVLLLHFTRKIGYIKSQIINITGWTLASIILMVDCIVFASVEIYNDFEKSIGFWCAAYTSGLYFGCTITLSIHYLGYRLRKYPPQFNLIPNERVVMIFTMLFSIWLSWGAAVFSAILDMSYCTALYFSMVSLLTVGLGDITPKTVASKIIVLAFSLSGFIILCLIIAITRGIITKSSGPIYFFSRVERKRRKVYNKVLSGELTLTDKESFDLIMKMRKVSKKNQKIRSIILTIVVFIAFWLFGALIFVFCEGWNYFIGIYFCFLCLLTIGYGDYYPTTGAGRAFFVVWSIMAIPLMSTLISTVGDTLYGMSESLDFALFKKFHMGIRDIFIKDNTDLNVYSPDRHEIVSDLDYVMSQDDENDLENTDTISREIRKVLSSTSTDTDKTIRNRKLTSNKPLSPIESQPESGSITLRTDVFNTSSPAVTINANVNPNENSISPSPVHPCIGITPNRTSTEVESLLSNDMNSSVLADAALLRKTSTNDVQPYTDLYDAFISDSNIDNEYSAMIGHHSKLEQLHKLLLVIKKMHGVTLLGENFELSYEQWSKLYQLDLLDRDDEDDDINPHFWIGPKTPLKYPLDQPHFVVLKLFNKIGEIITDLINDKEISRALNERNVPVTAGSHYRMSSTTTNAISSNISQPGFKTHLKPNDRPTPGAHYSQLHTHFEEGPHRLDDNDTNKSIRSQHTTNTNRSQGSYHTHTTHGTMHSLATAVSEIPHKMSLANLIPTDSDIANENSLNGVSSSYFLSDNSPHSVTVDYNNNEPYELLPEENLPPVMQFIRHGRNRSRKVRKKHRERSFSF